MSTPTGFVPPPYPYDRLDSLAAYAAGDREALIARVREEIERMLAEGPVAAPNGQVR